MKDGKLLLRDGRRINFSLAFMDSAAGSGSNTVFLRDGPVNLTDAERQLYDSDEGRCVIARAKDAHHLRTAYLGDRAPAFTDAQGVAAIKSHVAQREASARRTAEMTVDIARLQQQAEQARLRYLDDLRNGYRGR